MSPVVSNQHREERKNYILNAANEVFISKGFNATTIQDIINHSGVSRGGVYTYFQNTEDIFIELLKKRDMEDAVNMELLYQDGRTNWQALNYLLDQIQDSIEHQKDLLVPAIYEYYFTTGWNTKKHLPFLEKRVEQAKNHFSFILQKGIDGNEFNPSLPFDDIARTIISFCDGIYLACFHLGPDKIFLKNQFQVLRNFLASNLLCEKG